MNKILVIPDIHGRTFWKDAIDKHLNECDKVIFLGDYLDRYEDEEISRKQEKGNFEEIIKLKQDNPDKVVLLIGNHDEHYIAPSFTRSTRYSGSNSRKYREMFLTHFSFFKIAHEETVNDKKYLFTHAGVMKSWYERNKEAIGELTVDNLNKLKDYGGGISILGEISKYRTWFGEETGSPLWSDIAEKISDESNIDNVIPNDDSVVDEYDYQIFGHTRLHHELITDKWACLDCRKAFILNDDGNLIGA